LKGKGKGKKGKGNDVLIARLAGENLALALEDLDEAREAKVSKTTDLDARVLSVASTDGKRLRTFRDVVLLLTEIDWKGDGWPVHGPRTFLWLVSSSASTRCTRSPTTCGSGRSRGSRRTTRARKGMNGPCES